MVVHKIRNFGRHIFRMYETYPLLMNTIAGGIVYIAGEITSQLQFKEMKSFTQENWNNIMKIGILGAGENGIAMLTWYKLLNTYIGNGVTTKIVLIKCLFDQIFFATQQDFIFLILCAYNQLGDLPLALNDIKETFVTTWIMDCSLWPLVNFFGFAFVPYTLQPTYMACVSYFWQLYISHIAAKDNREKLVTLFNDIDLDQNHELDFSELKLAFENRGVTVTNEEIHQMIKDADASRIDSDAPRVNGSVSFEEFEVMVSSKCTAKSAGNWRTILEKVPLMKGAKKAIAKLNDMNTKKHLTMTTPSAGGVKDPNPTQTQPHTQTHTHTMVKIDPPLSSTTTTLTTATDDPQAIAGLISCEKIDLSFVPLPSSSSSPSSSYPSSPYLNPWSPTRYPTFHGYVTDPSKSTTGHSSQTPPLSDREQALRNVKWSVSILTGIALFRRIVLKI